jgi:hypothetical protein
MSKFIVTHTNETIGPAFNEAASILVKNKDVTILNTLNNIEVFVVEAPKSALTKLKKTLPGWSIRPNGNITQLLHCA